MDCLPKCMLMQQLTGYTLDIMTQVAVFLLVCIIRQCIALSNGAFMELTDMMTLIQSGAPAWVVLAYFAYRLEARMARIEKAFDLVVQHLLIEDEDK